MGRPNVRPDGITEQDEQELLNELRSWEDFSPPVHLRRRAELRREQRRQQKTSSGQRYTREQKAAIRESVQRNYAAWPRRYTQLVIQDMAANFPGLEVSPGYVRKTRFRAKGRMQEDAAIDAAAGAAPVRELPPPVFPVRLLLPGPSLLFAGRLPSLQAGTNEQQGTAQLSRRVSCADDATVSAAEAVHPPRTTSCRSHGPAVTSTAGRKRRLEGDQPAAEEAAAHAVAAAAGLSSPQQAAEAPAGAAAAADGGSDDGVAPAAAAAGPQQLGQGGLPARARPAAPAGVPAAAQRSGRQVKAVKRLNL